MKKLLLTLLLAAGITQAQVKIGTNPTTLGASSLLELENTNKALLITRVANTGVIASPVNGMIIYDLSVNCFKGYQNGAWTDCGFLFVSTSSNGSALVSAYSCSTATAGTLTMGVPASGVTQTITATVTTVGTYNIVTPTVNGVYFSATETFAGTGAQNIVLTATGTPTAVGTNSFTLNTTPNCSFNRTIAENSTNGSGIVSAYSCSTATAGTLNTGVPVSGVTQTITATVTTVGTYNISATANGVTFAATGTFTGTGAQNIVLTATGTPTAAGTNSFTLNTTPNCSFNRTTVNPAVAPTNPIGTGSFSGKTCFDVALSNDNTNSCGALSSRTANQANFTLSSTNTQIYTFTPSGTVSNVRFVYVNTNGYAITSLTGGNAGNNISTPVTATVTYANTLNSTATGLTSSNPITSNIYVVYNNSANNTGSDVQLKLTANIKDCACCGAFIAPNVFKNFLCHNLGANITLDPNVPNIGLFGAKIQWGKRGPNTTGDSRIDWQTAPNNGPLGFSAAPTAANTNIGAISGWSATNAADGSWVDYFKTIYDPCPAGYRVPVAAEWRGVLDNNTITKIGSFASSSTNFTSALHIGPNASSITLALPAAGVRAASSVVTYGFAAMYTSSTSYSSANFSLYYDISTSQVLSSSARLDALSVRCIAE